MDTDDRELLNRNIDNLSSAAHLRRTIGRRRTLRSARRWATSQTPGLNTAISPSDHMFRWAYPRNYFETGLGAARSIQSAVQQSSISEPARILDLPCGYGRVLRYFQAFWPNAELVAGELMPAAVNYCHRTFAARPLQSTEPVWEVDIGEDYDVIWSGSFLTHFDESHWQPTLEHFAKALSDKGLLVFSTVGRRVYHVLLGQPTSAAERALARMLPDNPLTIADTQTLVRSVADVGFGYSPYPNQPDRSYGLAVSMPAWVASQVEATAGLRLLHQHEGGWGSQDLWIAGRA
jgi:SAM-dependent methyltransferase